MMSPASQTIIWSEKIDLMKNMLKKQSNVRRKEALRAIKKKAMVLVDLQPAISVSNGFTPHNKVRCIMLTSYIMTSATQV